MKLKFLAFLQVYTDKAKCGSLLSSGVSLCEQTSHIQRKRVRNLLSEYRISDLSRMNVYLRRTERSTVISVLYFRLESQYETKTYKRCDGDVINN